MAALKCYDPLSCIIGQCLGCRLPFNAGGLRVGFPGGLRRALRQVADLVTVREMSAVRFSFSF